MRPCRSNASLLLLSILGTAGIILGGASSVQRGEFCTTRVPGGDMIWVHHKYNSCCTRLLQTAGYVSSHACLAIHIPLILYIVVYTVERTLKTRSGVVRVTCPVTCQVAILFRFWFTTFGIAFKRSFFFVRVLFVLPRWLRTHYDLAWWLRTRTTAAVSSSWEEQTPAAVCSLSFSARDTPLGVPANPHTGRGTLTLQASTYIYTYIPFLLWLV